MFSFPYGSALPSPFPPSDHLRPFPRAIALGAFTTNINQRSLPTLPTTMKAQCPIDQTCHVVMPTQLIRIKIVWHGRSDPWRRRVLRRWDVVHHATAKTISVSRLPAVPQSDGLRAFTAPPCATADTASHNTMSAKRNNPYNYVFFKKIDPAQSQVQFSSKCFFLRGLRHCSVKKTAILLK